MFEKVPKLCENCAFPQNFHIRKLGEITVFYAVKCNKSIYWLNFVLIFLDDIILMHK